MFKESGLQINNLEKKKADNYELPQSTVINTEESDQSFEMVKENSQKKDAQEIKAIREEIDLMQQTEKEQVVTSTPKIIPEQKNNFQSIFKKVALAVGITSAVAGKIEATNSSLESKNEDKQIYKTEQNIETDNKIPENSISWQAAKNETSTTPEGSEGKIEVASPSLNENLLINGGTIKEVVIYGRKQYEAELLKQQADMEKYATNLATYKKDSAEWAKTNQTYQDSLSLYNKSWADYSELIKNVPNIHGSTDNLLTGNEVLARIKNSLESEYQKAPNVYYDGQVKNVKDSQWNKGSKLENTETKDNTTLVASHKPVVDFIEEQESALIKPKYVPLTPSWGNPNNEMDKKWAWYSSVYDKPRGGLKDSPKRPESPKTERTKYDPTYEDLNMRSLWPTILKQNPNEKIGTLKNLDPLFEQGFTLDEAMTFPQEIKDKYNIDYIYNKIHGEKQK